MVIILTVPSCRFLRYHPFSEMPHSPPLISCMSAILRARIDQRERDGGRGGRLPFGSSASVNIRAATCAPGDPAQRCAHAPRCRARLPRTGCKEAQPAASCGNGSQLLFQMRALFTYTRTDSKKMLTATFCKRAGAHACDLLPLCAFKLRPLLKNGKCWQNENSDSKSGFDQTLHARKDSEIERSYATCGLTPFSPVRTL